MAFRVVIPIFPNVTQLDFTGPAQMFAKVPDLELCIAAKDAAPVPTDSGFSVNAPYTFADCPAADLVCVPGGGGVIEAIQDPYFLSCVERQCARARYVTSGVDFSLTVIAQVFGEQIARLIQLSMQYNPQPPFESGHPSVASETTVAQANAIYAQRAQAMRAALKGAKRS